MSPWKKVKMAIVRRKLLSSKIPDNCSNPLEEWMAIKTRETFKKNKELRQAIGKSELDHVTRADFEEYQMFQFRKQMRYVEENSAFYKERFRQAGVSADDIRCYADLTKVPLTTPDEMAADPLLLMAVSMTKTERSFSTTGTSGVRKRVFYTRNDLISKIDIIASALRNIGMLKGDVLHIMFPTVGAWDPSLMMAGACMAAGFDSSSSASIDIEEQMSIIKNNHSNYIIGLPSFIYRVTALAGRSSDLRTLGIKKIICAAEPLSESVRNVLQERWGCKVLDVWGMTEFGLACAIECDEQDGMHTDEANLLFEIIDPETGEHKDYREKGELVVTSLTAEGTPIIRYRTRDYSALIGPPCGCGTVFNKKIQKPSGRMDMMTKVGLGQKIYPLLFDEAVLSVPGVISYQVLIDKEDFRDKLTFVIESEDQSEKLRKTIINSVSTIPEIEIGISEELIETPRVEFRDINRSEYASKAKIIVDRRSLYDN